MPFRQVLTTTVPTGGSPSDYDFKEADIQVMPASCHSEAGSPAEESFWSRILFLFPLPRRSRYSPLVHLTLHRAVAPCKWSHVLALCAVCPPPEAFASLHPPRALRLRVPAYGRGWPGSSGQHRLRPLHKSTVSIQYLPARSSHKPFAPLPPHFA